MAPRPVIAHLRSPITVIVSNITDIISVISVSGTDTDIWSGPLATKKGGRRSTFEDERGGAALELDH